MVQIQDTIVSLDVITKEFCCDLKKCHGACCVEGDAGAPVTPDEIARIEELLPVIRDMLSADALKAIEETMNCVLDWLTHRQGDIATHNHQQVQ